MQEVENSLQFRIAWDGSNVKAEVERNNRWKEMMRMDGDLKFLMCDLVIVNIKTNMLLTNASISMNWHFFLHKIIPRSTAYYSEPQFKNLMILMTLCWELLMGWGNSRLGLKLLRACRRILLCHPLAGSISNCHNNVPKLDNFTDKIGTHNNFWLVLSTCLCILSWKISVRQQAHHVYMCPSNALKKSITISHPHLP